MSTCRVTNLNQTSTAPAPAAPVPPAEPPAQALVFHTDYEWNSSGTRIRCAHEQCGEILDMETPGDTGEAEAVFAEHQRAVLGAIPAELAALRTLKAALPDLLADLAHGAPVLRIETDLFRLVAEADAAIGSARELLIEPAV